MSFSKNTVLNNSGADYRLLSKTALKELSKLLSDILTKYECSYTANAQFSIHTASNTIQEDASRFDECFDNRIAYNALSFFASGTTADNSKKLNIIVGFNFYTFKPVCHITLSGIGITEPQQTDIVENITAFICKAAKVELPEQSPTNTNKTGKTVDSIQDKKLRLPKAVKLIFKVIAAIGTIAAAIVAVYEVFSIFF